MKSSLLIIYCLFLISCTTQSPKVGDNLVNALSPATHANDNYSNSNNIYKTLDAHDDPAHLERLKQLGPRLEKFREVPQEFKKVDFKNFNYKNKSNPSVRLKNGEYEENPEAGIKGNFIANYSDVFYTDLLGDSRKEAVVLIDYYFCGGSCSGTATTIYFFVSSEKTPKMIGRIETGCRSCGCSLKSIEIKNKLVTLSQFGKCINAPDEDDNNKNDIYSCKYCVEDETITSYSFIGNLLQRGELKVSETQETNIINYQTEISIDE